MTLLLGFIGGLAAVALKGAVDFYFEWRRERRALQSAARLIAYEFEVIALWASLSVEQRRWLPPGRWVFDQELWREAKGILASSLSPNDWRLVLGAYSNVGFVEEAYELSTHAGRWDLGGEEAHRLTSEYAGIIEDGARVLRRVGRHPLEKLVAAARPA